MADVYQQLAMHLDNLPAGFPSTETGVEIRILKRLFTPREAEIAMGLVMMPEPVSAIADRLKTDEAALAPVLEDMSRKGLIYRSGKQGQKLYMAAQFVIGIWEYHVKSLDTELIRDFNEYSPYLMKQAWTQGQTKQLRETRFSRTKKSRHPDADPLVGLVGGFRPEGPDLAAASGQDLARGHQQVHPRLGRGGGEQGQDAHGGKGLADQMDVHGVASMARG